MVVNVFELQTKFQAEIEERHEVYFNISYSVMLLNEFLKVDAPLEPLQK